MSSLLDSPFSPVIGSCLFAGLALSLLARLVRTPSVAGLVAPMVFLLAYYMTYEKIPGFPPVGATNKIFYVALVTTLAGLLYDLMAPSFVTGSCGLLAVVVTASLLIAVWIALPRFIAGDTPLLVAALATVAVLVLGGTLLLWRLATVDEAGAVDGTVLLAVLPGIFAPIALFGGSSTSVGLCLGLVSGLAMMALVNLIWPRALGLTAVLGAGGGLLAVIDTITLITRHIDFLALAVFLAAPFAGLIGARLVLPRHQAGSRVRAVATGVIAAQPSRRSWSSCSSGTKVRFETKPKKGNRHAPYTARRDHRHRLCRCRGGGSYHRPRRRLHHRPQPYAYSVHGEPSRVLQHDRSVHRHDG